MKSWKSNKTPSRRHTWIALLTLLAVVIGVCVYIIAQREPYGSRTQPLIKPEVRPKVSQNLNELATGRYLFNGTVAWARAVEQQASGDYNQPFSMLDSFNRSQYDGWYTDLECPITKNTVPYQTQISELIFNCRPEFLPFASKYFNIFNLANNHTDNQDGEKGLEETRQHLNTAGVQYFGTFDSADTQNVCEILALPIRVQKNNKSEQKSAIPVAFCGWHYFYRKPTLAEITAMNKYAKVMPVFAFVHMGSEYQAKASSLQEEIARSIIDQGAEFLIANNPHWVQNTEVYKGKLIAYSTGNFIFDQLDSETNRSASIDLTMTIPHNDNVARWIALAPTCAVFHDDCLAQAEKQGLSKVKLQLKYGVVAGQNGYKELTRKADAITQSAVEQRANWHQTLKELGQITP